MPAIDFPANPLDGQLFTASGITWSWNQTKTAWFIVNNGVQGFQGVQGAQGFQGVQGPAGGPQGDVGAQGTQGAQGADGPQGFQGESGVQGAQGFQGEQGTDVGLAKANLAYAQANAAYETANAALTNYLPLTGGTIANNGSLIVTGNVTVQNNMSVLNVFSAGSISDQFSNLRKMPISGAEKTTNYSLANNDIGRLVVIASGGSISVPSGVFSGGDVVSFYNNTASNVTITTSSVTAYLSGNNTTRTSVLLYPRGLASILYITSNSCVLTGTLI
jgi:hypothetical protein